KKFADGTTIRCTYDYRGKLTEEVAPNGVKTIYVYDHFGRPISSRMETKEGLLAVKYMTYNTFHLISEESPTGEILTHSYDGSGRKVATRLSGPSGTQDR